MSHRGRKTDHELLGQLASKDGDWGTFVAKYYHQILAIATSKVKDPDEAQDIAQDVMMKLVRHLRKGWKENPDKTGFQALLHVIISHCTASHMNRKNRQLRGGDELPTGPLLEKALQQLETSGTHERDPVEVAGESPQDRLVLEDALSQLSDEDRLVLTYDGKGTELAKELEKKPGAIRAQKLRARKRLKANLRRRMAQWQTEPRPVTGGRFAIQHLIWAGQLILDQRQGTGSGPSLLFRRRVSDAHQVESIRLGQRTAIGRDTFAGLDPPLFDPEISGRHCCIEHRHDSWWLEELGSTNPTIINGKNQTFRKGDVVELGDGDRLEIGRQLLVFSNGEMAPEEEA